MKNAKVPLIPPPADKSHESILKWFEAIQWIKSRTLRYRCESAHVNYCPEIPEEESKAEILFNILKPTDKVRFRFSGRDFLLPCYAQFCFYPRFLFSKNREGSMNCTDDRGNDYKIFMNKGRLYIKPNCKYYRIFDAIEILDIEQY